MGRLADNRNRQSWASEFRRRRARAFFDLLNINSATRILDLGGSHEFWLNAGVRGDVTLLNVGPAAGGLPEGFRYLQGDARDLSRFRDREFDAVFSNSVIEHVGGEKDQQAMAREIRRVGRSYFVQTPNRWFPIEPHYLFPCFQFLPAFLRRFVARHWRWGWYDAGSNRAMRDADTIRLLSVSDVAQLFPHSFVLGERFGPLNKSLIAVRGDIADPAYPGFRMLVAPGNGRGAASC